MSKYHEALEIDGLNLDSKHKAFILMDAWILVQRHSVRGKGIMDVWDLLLLAFICQPKEFQAVFNRRPCTPDGTSVR